MTAKTEANELAGEARNLAQEAIIGDREGRKMLRSLADAIDRLTSPAAPMEAGEGRYILTQEQMERLHGAAHSGALLGGYAAYRGCLKIEAILAETHEIPPVSKLATDPGQLTEAGEVCDGCGKLLICRHCGKLRSATRSASPPPAADVAGLMEALQEIKKIALSVKTADVPKGLAHIVRLCIDALSAAESQWKCAGRKQSLPEPTECDWPVCGCDPYADKVIAALQESGALAAAPSPDPVAANQFQSSDGGGESRPAIASGSGPLPEPMLVAGNGRQQEPKRAVGVAPGPSEAIIDPAEVRRAAIEKAHPPADTQTLPRPADCAHPLSCGWRRVLCEPDIGLHLCNHANCRYELRALAPEGKPVSGSEEKP